MAAFAAEVKPDWKIEEFLGGTQVVRTISRATDVRMWRVERRAPKVASTLPYPKGEAADTVAKYWFNELRATYVSVGDGTKLDKSQTMHLGELLTSVSSYHRSTTTRDEWRSAKICGFHPVVRLQFTAEDVTAEAWVCFFCSDVWFMNADRRTGAEDIRAISRELLTLVKSLLKGDPVIAKVRVL
ncbi:MAG: hypothetical protein Q8N18_26580 [Opitutaceae bacterium]|nr:hypothetical protein [Opitutaceae bacterium]